MGTVDWSIYLLPDWVVAWGVSLFELHTLTSIVVTIPQHPKSQVCFTRDTSPIYEDHEAFIDSFIHEMSFMRSCRTRSSLNLRCRWTRNEMDRGRSADTATEL